MSSLPCWHIYFSEYNKVFLYLIRKYLKLINPLPLFMYSLFVASLLLSHFEKIYARVAECLLNATTEFLGIIGQNMNMEENKKE